MEMLSPMTRLKSQIAGVIIIITPAIWIFKIAIFSQPILIEGNIWVENCANSGRLLDFTNFKIADCRRYLNNSACNLDFLFSNSFPKCI